MRGTNDVNSGNRGIIITNENGMTINIELGSADEFSLEVSDSGRAVPQAIAEQLFKKHVRSENGLGIGLYHAARQARQAGYSLSLAENRDGAVRFRLVGE